MRFQLTIIPKPVAIQYINKCKMLLRLLSPLVMLLGMVSMNNAQFGTCDYEEVMVVGKSYPLFSPNWPYDNYPPGAACRWVAKSDRPINMICNTFRVPESSQCRLDYVSIQTSTAPAQRYCGDRTINIISEGHKIIVELHSSGKSPGGHFYCTLKTAITDEQCRCGWKNPTRIVGGENTGVNEYPMMAGLVDSDNKNIFCGGTIINNKQILTAAHCIKNMKVRKVGVVVGEHDTERGDETNATKVFRVSKFIIHSQYSEKNQDYDIAIVVITGTIEFNQLVGLVCLPFQHSPDTFAGNYVDILGWGSLGISERTSNILQKVQVHIITNRECSNYYQNITTRQMCTVEQDKDACQFDSGGPVLWMNPSTKRIMLTSIVSYGSICADGTPAVNSRVGAFIDWILEHTPPGFQYCESE